MKLTYFKRMNCAICGRRATMKFIRGQLKTAPCRKVWICIIHCPHCEPREMGVAESKEIAKARAVKWWNVRQTRASAAMKRVLKNLFANYGT